MDIPAQKHHNMEICLPPRGRKEECLRVINPRNIVIIGANGAGKSRFGEELERNYPGPTCRISAFDAVSPTLNEPSSNDGPVTGFDRIISMLQREEFKTLTDSKETWRTEGKEDFPVTRLDLTREVWEEIFPKSRIRQSNGELQTMAPDSDRYYPIGEMSHGEKVVFYQIAATLFAPDNSLITVEDPEILLHPSIVGNFWVKVEQCRTDCTFVYLTHDIGFATSRSEGVRIWVRSFDGAHRMWDYEVIENQYIFPEEIYLELLGSRKPILFVEGTDNSSLDIRLYPYIFPDYMVKPLGGCAKVIETTKAFSEMKSFHHLESKGIVDRDRRTPHEIAFLRERNIFVPNVAEVENLLMLEDVIKTVARRMLQDEEKVFKTVRENVVKLFLKDLDGQALLHTRHQLRNKIEYMIDRRLGNIEELCNHIEHLTEDIDCRKMYEEIRQTFKNYVEMSNYDEILRVYNQKGMLPQSRVTNLCGLANKEKYLNFILSVLKENKDDAARIRKAIRHCFGLE